MFSVGQTVYWIYMDNLEVLPGAIKTVNQSGQTADVDFEYYLGTKTLPLGELHANEREATAALMGAMNNLMSRP